MEEYKIQVIKGINDIPLPPNYNGNGQSCNGAYYIKKFNDIVDYISWIEPNISLNVEISSNFPLKNYIELEKDFLEWNESLEISYSIDRDIGSTGYIYGGFDKNHLEIISPPISSNDVYEYYPNEFSIIPNNLDHPGTFYIEIRGQIETGVHFISSNRIELTWGEKNYFGLSLEDDLTDPELLESVSSSIAPCDGLYIENSDNNPKYLYLFLNPDYKEFSAIIDTRTRLNIPLIDMGDYIYRTAVKTFGNWQVLFDYV